MAVRTAYDPTAGEILTATNLERLAGGWIGYNEVTANQGSIAGTDVDLTTLTVAVTVGPSRRIRISGYVGLLSTVASDVFRLTIYEGASALQSGFVHLSVASVQSAFFTTVVLTPSTGAHTYKLAMARTNGTGTGTMTASASQPAHIVVEDIGPAA